LGLLLGFAPLIVFSIVTGLSVDLALWAAFAVAFVLAIRDFAQTRILRSLDVGSTLLFGLLAIYAGFIHPSISVQAVRLIVDGGFLVVCGAFVLGGTPFTLDYMREQVSKELRRTRDFLRTHQVVSAAWLFAFAAMSAVDAVATFNKKFPVTLDGAASLAVLTLAVIFTARHRGVQALQPVRIKRPRPTRLL
jgi:signal transduction histidine kinase